MELTITQPDDWHLHLRDGSLLEAVLPHRSFCLQINNIKKKILSDTLLL